MDVGKCAVLVRAIDMGSFSAAAAVLGYTPSGVTRMVNAVENEIGFPVVARNSKGIVLTENGKQMLPILRELVRWDEMARQRSAELQGLVTGNLNIGAYYSVAASWLPKIIKTFQADFPGITIHMMEGGNSELARWVTERRVDFAIYSKRDMNCEWITLRKDPLVAWLPENHPLAKKKAVPLQALNGAPFIKPLPGKHTDVEQLLEQEKLAPDIKFTTSDNYSVYCMVEAGLGISVNNALMASGWHGHVAVRPLKPARYITLGIAIPSRKDASPAARKFISYVKRFVK